MPCRSWQYTQIAHPDAFDVIGAATTDTQITVNTLAAQRLGEYFRRELGADNAASALWEEVIIEATLPGAGVGGGDIVTTREGHRYVAPATEIIQHDEDGNLVTDGRWVYQWDAENRLIEMTTAPAAIAAGIPRRKLDFAYDGDSRRIAKTVSDWDETANGGMGDWEIVDERRFVYDQWNLVAEIDPTDAPLRTHTWGLDLSQTMQGAGGVGGLLWTTDHTDGNRTHFAAYDGNGNVTALVSSADSSVAARYDYNAFGQTILIDGEDQAIAESNPFRFSTKYEDGETGLYYYGYRYLDTETGRWLNRDPIEERGGVNLYGFAYNSPIDWIDILGTNPVDEFATSQAPNYYAPRRDGAYLINRAIFDTQERFRESLAVKNGTGLLQALVKFSNLAGYNVWIGDSNYYLRPSRSMTLRDDASDDIVLHELVHAYNHLKKTGIGGFTATARSLDEGMAYQLQNVYEAAITLARHERRMENTENVGSCKGVIDIYRDVWADFWERNAIHANRIHDMKIIWNIPFYGPVGHPIREIDDLNLLRILGVGLSCQHIADVFNRSELAKKCCMRFYCEASGPDLRMNATINSIYAKVELPFYMRKRKAF